jgi:Flp pilus assembly protein TadG
MTVLSRLANCVRIRGFLKDRRGVSAVEFALIAPILIMTYLALAELTLGMMAGRRTSHLAATIGDLAAQSEALTDANVTDLWAIGSSMLQPFATGSDLKVRLTCVTMGADKVARVNWSDGHNIAEYADGSTIATITTDQISEGESVVMTEVEYDYTSPIGEFLPGDTHFKDVFFHHPRNGTAIVRKVS